MMSYTQLLLTILPVLAIIGLGAFVRHRQWVTQEGETSLFKLVLNVTFPALIYDSVAGNPVLREPGNLVWAPTLGFGLTLLSMAMGWYAARALGLTIGHGLRTFALAVGLTNYGYLPLPILDAMFGVESRAMLFVHNVGVEAALWTGGVLVVSGLSPRDSWRKLINMPIIALVVALTVNLTGAAAVVPDFVNTAIHSLAACSVPFGLLMSGVSIQPHLDEPKQLVDTRVTLTALLLRLLLLPWVFLLAARYLPCSVELKRVLVVQAAMPAGVVSIIVARVYGGRPLVAAQIVIGTTALALFTIPFWIRFGLQFVGIAE